MREYKCIVWMVVQQMQCKYNALTKIVQKYNLMLEKGANMATTNFTMRIDEAVKAQLQQLMKDKRQKEQD